MSKVEKTFSFASWASDHPSDPVPGDRIDIEFNAHRAAIDSLDEAVQRLLRADGKLNHDLLTEESMPKDLLVALAGKTKREIQDFVDPLVAQTKHHLSDLEAAQFDLQATLQEIKQRQREATKLLDSTAALSEIVHTHARQAMQAVTRAANVQAQTIEDANWQTLQANTSQDWALVSTTWAEFMDGNATIPPNILASNSITGDHWSSRWWAHRAAGAAGMLAWWYQGAWPSPGPPSTPDDPTGQPLPPGSIYFDTDDNKMYVWTGSSWVPLAQGPAAATTSSLYYLATAGQTVFPLASNDHFGASFSFNQTHPEGLHALVNGVRLTPTDDYAVNVASSTVTLARPMSLNAVVGFDILTPVSQLSPSGSAKTYLLSPLAPDGVLTVFPLAVAAGSPVVNVAHNEELLVSVDGVQQSPGQAYNASGNQITFAQPPDANALIFIVWFGPSATTQSAPSHSPQALAYLARTVGGDEGGNGANIATLIDGLVSDGVWAKLDALYVLAQQNATDALLNLVGTSYTATNVNGSTFTVYKGYAFLGGQYLDTGFNAATATSPNFTQNSASFGAWSYATVSEMIPIMGNGGSGAACNIYTSYGGTAFYTRVNDILAGSVPTPGAQGLFVGDRSSSTNVVPYWNGVSQGPVTSTSGVPLNADFTLSNVPGTFAQQSMATGQTLSAAFIGASLGAAGQLALYNRLRTYMTAVGAP